MKVRCAVRYGFFAVSLVACRGRAPAFSPGRDAGRCHPEDVARAADILNGAVTRTQAHGSANIPIFSPNHTLLGQGHPLEPALRAFPVVVWTVNDEARMRELIGLGVRGIITDRPDLLYEVVAAFDADDNGTPGDLLTSDRLVDADRFDLEGHRGARGLRPENTLPAFEAGLDAWVTTLEMDAGLTHDRVPVIAHDPTLLGTRIRDVTLAQIQDATNPILRDGLVENGGGKTTQRRDPALSPVSVAFWTARGRSASQLYLVPSLDDVFDFVAFYLAYYEAGPGASHPDAARRAKNAARVRFNIETKIDPCNSEATLGPDDFVTAIAGRIERRGLSARADIESFDFRTLSLVEAHHPAIRTVYLF